MTLYKTVCPDGRKPLIVSRHNSFHDMTASRYSDVLDKVMARHNLYAGEARTDKTGGALVPDKPYKLDFDSLKSFDTVFAIEVVGFALPVFVSLAKSCGGHIERIDDPDFSLDKQVQNIAVRAHDKLTMYYCLYRHPQVRSKYSVAVTAGLVREIADIIFTNFRSSCG